LRKAVNEAPGRTKQNRSVAPGTVTMATAVQTQDATAVAGKQEEHQSDGSKLKTFVMILKK
jgi:hypothetical protein